MRCCVLVLVALTAAISAAQQDASPSKPDSPRPNQQSPAHQEEKAQTPLAPPAVAEKAADYSQQAFVIEKYLTKIRFENDGTSEREQITRIRVQTQAGVQAFGQLHFPYNAANDKIEIASVKVTKPNGAVTTAGTDAVQDLTAPVAREAPIYSDLHQKDVVVPGLSPGDVLEYDVKVNEFEPLAKGQFWWEQQFIQKVIVLDEELQIDVPAGRVLKMRNKTVQPQITTAGGRTTYLWKNAVLKVDDEDSSKDKKKKKKKQQDEDDEIPDVQLSTFQSWDEVGRWYSSLERDRVKPDATIRAKAAELTASAKSDTEKVEDLYDFVAPRYRYVGISFGVGRFQPHSAADVLSNRYGDCKDKHTLLASLIKAAGLDAYPVLIHHSRKLDESVPSPAQFDHVITFVPLKNGPDKAGNLQGLWLDSTTEVAPFRMLAAPIRNKQALLVLPNAPAEIVTTPADLPTENLQDVKVTAKINQIGKLEATYEYTVRGDSELAFRIAFRGTPENQWKHVIEYLNAYEGLAGDVDDVKVSDPSDTHHPLEFSYKLTQANYLDWTTKSSQVPIPLPRLDMSWTNLDDSDDEDRTKPYEFPAAPLATHEDVKVELPDGYNYRPPLPIDVKRDYASFSSTYKLDGRTLTVHKELTVEKREIAPTRGSDLRAFVRAVGADLSQSVFAESLSANSGSNIPAGMSADDLNDAGIAALKNQNYRAATELLKKVVELEPKHKDAWNNLGRAYLALGKYDDSIAAFKKQIEINSFDEFAYNNLGLAYQSQQKYDDAAAAYKKQLEVNPLDQFAHGNLGSLYLEQKKYPDAVSELERAVQITPQNPGLEANLGRAYLNMNEPDKALAAFDKAVELAPSPVIWNNVAYELSVHKAHLDKALTYAESATSATEAALRNIDLNHLTLNDVGMVMSIGSYWDTLGWVYFQNNQLEKAKRYIEAAWLLDQHSEIGDHLGQLYEKLGRRQDAIRYYAMAVTAAHKIPESEQHLKSLVPDAKEDTAEVEKARKELEMLRSVRLPWSGGKDAKAEFFLTFDAPSSLDSKPLKPDQVKFLSGDESLRPFTAQLQASSFHVQFPDDTPIKLVRRGVLSCEGATHECSMVLMLPEDVRTVD
jgi:tetratricopeptide (TPR) repeat protein